MDEDITLFKTEDGRIFSNDLDAILHGNRLQQKQTSDSGSPQGIYRSTDGGETWF